jgi:predicted NAD/FAD-dependent oxidoreductase
VTGRAAAREADTVVVGAGIAGLACARALNEAGRPPIVLERSRGLGGRCATRRVAGQAVDHGVAFLHGSDGAFVDTIRAAGGPTPLDGWPVKIEGSGPPCLPKAFEPFERRLAYADGVTVFPKHLAHGLDVRLETPVASLSAASAGIHVHALDGASWLASSVVLAVPPPTALRLLRSLRCENPEAAAVGAVLGMIGSQSCLTALAGYPLDVNRPSWDIGYPDDSAIVQLISHDSSKRTGARYVVLVAQARPCWSRVQFDEPEGAWTAELIRETARLVGAWAETPSWVQAHRWRFARSDRGSEMSRPVSLRVPGGGRVIITGESFVPGGGIEAAWLAGIASARRLLEEE